MKIWYKAVCDEHKECINIFVDTPSRTALYLSEHDQDIYAWLLLHRGCKLRMIHDDCDLDECWENGVEDVLRHRPQKKS